MSLWVEMSSCVRDVRWLAVKTNFGVFPEYSKIESSVLGMSSELRDPRPAVDPPADLVLAGIVDIDVPDDLGWVRAGELADARASVLAAARCENVLPV